MAEENYPSVTCTTCALIHGGKWPSDHIGSFMMDICDICNEWTTVTDPSDYSFPEFTLNRNLPKILSQCIIAFDKYKVEKNYEAANILCDRIDAMIHEILVKGEEYDISAIISYRKQRRAVRARSGQIERAMRKSAKEPVC